jgi:uncharacterized repeat protein (TIGR03803 family)
MQHCGWRSAIHLLVGILLVTAVIGTLLAQLQGTLQGTATEVVLYSFKGPSHGASPQAGVVRDRAGNLYGTTENGGAGGNGVVFRVDPAGRETVLYSFTGGTDGGHPWSGVIGDSAGNLYGTTVNGGPAKLGVVFKLDPTGHETVLYSFTGGTDAENPAVGVIRDSAGNLYGTTSGGGTAGLGAVYKLDATGHETVLYSFTGGADGGNPYAGVIGDGAGNLYGTTYSGGSGTLCGFVAGCGVVYKLDVTGQETVLYSFTGGADGSSPQAGVIRDSAGNLYGTTLYGGGGNCTFGHGCGVVFKLGTTGHETVLYSFTGGADGGNPYAGVIGDGGGNLYGTTYSGGITTTDACSPTRGCGVVYKVDATGHETVLYNFTRRADGAFPHAGVIGDGAGNLYGTTANGGQADLGVVYKLDSTGHETALYSFPAGGDGAYPLAGVIGDGAGNLYGTTHGGGINVCPPDGFSGCGVVFKLDSAGQETVLHTFTGGVDGSNPIAGVIRDSAGNLYGTTSDPGGGFCVSLGFDCGAVFKLDPTGNETVLHSFNGADGANPTAGVVPDRAGNLYGTTSYGGGVGVVFRVDPTGHETVLYSFTGGADGGYPFGGVIGDSAGNLYGTNSSGGITTGICSPFGCGVVFGLDSAGHETVLYSFSGGADGSQPQAGVIRDSVGNLYGTTQFGGITTGICSPFGCGVVFKLDSAGHETVLYSFTGGADGSQPWAGVIRDSAGNLYGTASEGGPANVGVVYKVDAAGHYTVLYSFTGGAAGANSQAGVILDSAGNLYGTTVNGGPANAGVVYRIKP